MVFFRSSFLFCLVFFVGVCSAGKPTGALTGFAAERVWSDATGKFKVTGRLESADRDSVQLRKADGLAVKIPVSKLGEDDQKYVKAFLEAERALGGTSPPDSANPFAGGVKDTSVMSAEQAALPQDADLPLRPAGFSRMKPMQAKPTEAFWSAQPPRPFPAVQFPEAVVATSLPKPFFAGMRMRVAGASGTVVLNSYRQERKPENQYGNFVVIDSSSGQASPLVSKSLPWKLMAISPDGKRVAAVRVVGFDKGNDVAIFSIKSGQLIGEFQFTAGGGSWDELHWIGFLPGNRLATISQKHHLTFWDLSDPAGPQAVNRGMTGGALTAEMSLAGELIAMPVGSAIGVVDTRKNDLVGYIVRNEKANKLAFSPDGKYLAAYHPFNLTLYSTADGSEVKTIAVSESKPNPVIRWVGKHMLVGKVLYDVEKSVPMWTYETRANSQTSLSDYVFSAFGGDKESTVVISRLPHAQAVQAIAGVDPSAIYAVRPGDPVKVSYDFGAAPPAVQQEIESVIEKKLSDIGWTKSDSGPIELIVSMELGDQETIEYFETNGIGFMPISMRRPTGPSTKVTVRPWTQKLQIKGNGDQLFLNTVVRKAPQSLSREKNESVQAAASRHCTPSPASFARIPIPPYLLKSQYQGGVGKSTISAKGLE